MSKYAKYYNFKEQTCHKATEVYKNLWLSFGDDPVLYKKCNVLVPLNGADTDIYDDGFDGELLYYPTPDFSVLPQHIAVRCAKQIIKRLKAGRVVGIYCYAGHGRTGYMAAIVLGMLGNADPIGTIRKNYCKHAVESYSQIKQIAKILDMPSQLEYKVEPKVSKWDGKYANYGTNYGGASAHSKWDPVTKTWVTIQNNGNTEVKKEWDPATKTWIYPSDAGATSSEPVSDDKSLVPVDERKCYYCAYYDPSAKHCAWKDQFIIGAHMDMCNQFIHYLDNDAVSKAGILDVK